tara:strand:- start:2031 stop:2264 length:234 start_codon:yes stop_codon:yes gene_type:complete
MNGPNFFPMSKIPDLVQQLQGKAISYEFVLEKKNENAFVWTKYKGRFYVQIVSLEKWLGVEPGIVIKKWNPERGNLK